MRFFKCIDVKVTSKVDSIGFLEEGGVYTGAMDITGSQIYIDCPDLGGKSVRYWKWRFKEVFPQGGRLSYCMVRVAYANGFSIQYRGMGDVNWFDIGKPSFCHGYDYRVKPDNSEEVDRIRAEIAELAKQSEALTLSLKGLL